MKFETGGVFLTMEEANGLKEEILRMRQERAAMQRETEQLREQLQGYNAICGSLMFSGYRITKGPHLLNTDNITVYES